MSPLAFFVVAAGGLIAAGCSYLSPTELAARDGQKITPATVEQITADPYGWSGKWVSFKGVLVLRPIESRIYANEAAARDGSSYDEKAVGIQMSEASYIPSSLDGEWVTATGQVDASCNAAHAAAEQAMKERDVIAWASGFCHTSIGPHLDHASIRAVRSSQ